jgi:alkanesulfonate monooxygenase SsuD/methylene tetrahydromethanopterin reductase-like flavin-dependent oxidoreductase (luciferase family)
MIDAIVCWGDETRVAARIQDLFACGATEVLLSPIGAGEDQAASVRRTTALLAELATSPVP